MSQHDFSIANQTGASFRSDLNDALAALVTWNSGASDPATTFARMRAVNTTTGVVKRRNAANSGWIIESTDDEARIVDRSSNTILDESDITKTFRATASFTQTLTAAATLGDGWWAGYRVESGATITFDPNSSENIDGATTKVVVGPASGVIVCNGSAFYTIGFAQIVTGTEQATTSGTSKDFTIPAGAKRVTLTLVGVSTNGTAAVLVQLGDSGGVETTGYVTSGGSLASGPSVSIGNRTDGWADETGNAAAVRHGSITLTLQDPADNTWAGFLCWGRSDAAILHMSSGTKSLSGVLTTVRLTTGNGTDAFDAGVANVSWEF